MGSYSMTATPFVDPWDFPEASVSPRARQLPVQASSGISASARLRVWGKASTFRRRTATREPVSGLLQSCTPFSSGRANFFFQENNNMILESAQQCARGVPKPSRVLRNRGSARRPLLPLSGPPAELRRRAQAAAALGHQLSPRGEGEALLGPRLQAAPMQT